LLNVRSTNDGKATGPIGSGGGGVFNVLVCAPCASNELALISVSVATVKNVLRIVHHPQLAPRAQVVGFFCAGTTVTTVRFDGTR
jgi:hypothetical protein